MPLNSGLQHNIRYDNADASIYDDDALMAVNVLTSVFQSLPCKEPDKDLLGEVLLCEAETESYASLLKHSKSR